MIFASELAALAAEHPHRLVVVHWLESVQGLPTQEQMKAFTEPFTTYDAFVCGPAPFMKLTIAALRELEFPRERRHQEKFISLGGNPFGDPEEQAEAEHELEEADSDAEFTEGLPEPEHHEPAEGAPEGNVRLEVELDGETYAFDDWAPTTKLLEHLESKGVKAPYSCREGECSACAVRLLEGEVKMLNNDVLDDEDLAEGIRLACQSLPVTDVVRRLPLRRHRAAGGRQPVPGAPIDHGQRRDDAAHDRVDEVVLGGVDQRQRHRHRVEQQQPAPPAAQPADPVERDQEREAAVQRRHRGGLVGQAAEDHGGALDAEVVEGRGWRSGPAAAAGRRSAAIHGGAIGKTM